MSLFLAHAKSIASLVAFQDRSFPRGNSGIQADILWLSHLAPEAPWLP